MTLTCARASIFSASSPRASAEAGRAPGRPPPLHRRTRAPRIEVLFVIFLEVGDGRRGGVRRGGTEHSEGDDELVCGGLWRGECVANMAEESEVRTHFVSGGTGRALCCEKLFGPPGI